MIFLREQVRLLTTGVKVLRDKVNELEEKLENITPETNSTDSSEPTENELKPKQLVPLDAFASYTEGPTNEYSWCELDSKLLDRRVGAVDAACLGKGSEECNKIALEDKEGIDKIRKSVTVNAEDVNLDEDVSVDHVKRRLEILSKARAARQVVNS
ncbi:hypothetical protein EMCRGX_G024273 [Ephydatia muelleri]